MGGVDQLNHDIPAIFCQCLYKGRGRGTYCYPANTGTFFFLLLVVLLGELHEVACTHIITKPKLLLAHARADLDTVIVRMESYPCNGNDFIQCCFRFWEYGIQGCLCATPFPLTTTNFSMSVPIPPSFTAGVRSFTDGLGRTVCTHGNQDVLRPLLVDFLLQQHDALGGFSIADIAGFSPHAPSPEPPSHFDPPPPSDKLQLLCTSFETSFTTLAMEPQELKTQVSGLQAAPPPPQILCPAQDSHTQASHPTQGLAKAGCPLFSPHFCHQGPGSCSA